MTGVSTFTVEEDEAGLRLDRWFRRRYPGLTHGRLEKLLRTGQIRLDGGRVKGATRLEAGQIVRVPPLEGSDRDRKSRRPSVKAEDAEFIRSLVIHRDDHVIALNKPPGLAVQGGSKVTRHVDGMLDALKFKASERPRLVHRLDKDTGGLLLLARSARAASSLAEAFRGRDAEKTYWALVSGAPSPKEGRIDLALSKGSDAGRERMLAGLDDGRRAVTDFAVVDSAGSRVAWLVLKPRSGRTHQLRVHCAEIGTPIVGDRKYGDENSRIDGLPGRNLLNLHARGLRIPHPAGGTLSLKASLSADMMKNWSFFGFDTDNPEAERLSEMLGDGR
jgi:23S rRNA pseudouridine955/2504/2580 synthase